MHVAHVAHRRRVGDEDRVVGDRVAQRLDDRGRRADRTQLLRDGRPEGLRLLGAQRPRADEPVERVAQCCEREPGVARHGHPHRLVPADLVGVGVDLDHRQVGGEAEPLKTGAHREHDVGIVEHRAQPRVVPHRPDHQRVAGVDRALALASRHDERLEQLGDGRALRRGVGEHHSTAGDDQWTLGAGEQAGGFGHAVRIGDGRRGDGGGQDRRVGGVHERLGRCLHVDGAGPAGAHLHERLVDRAGQLTGLEHPGRPLGDRAHDVELVVDVVEQAEVTPDPGPVDLAGEHQDGRRARPGGGQAGHGVVDAHPGHHAGDAGPPRGPGVAVGHVGGRLLVAGGEPPDVGVVERVEQVHGLVAGQAEHDLHSLGDQLVDRRPAPRRHL